jgi:hypothetical protein
MTQDNILVSLTLSACLKPGSVCRIRISNFALQTSPSFRPSGPGDTLTLMDPCRIHFRRLRAVGAFRGFLPSSPRTGPLCALCVLSVNEFPCIQCFPWFITVRHPLFHSELSTFPRPFAHSLNSQRSTPQHPALSTCARSARAFNRTGVHPALRTQDSALSSAHCPLPVCSTYPLPLTPYHLP